MWLAGPKVDFHAEPAHCEPFLNVAQWLLLERGAQGLRSPFSSTRVGAAGPDAPPSTASPSVSPASIACLVTVSASSKEDGISPVVLGNSAASPNAAGASSEMRSKSGSTRSR